MNLLVLTPLVPYPPHDGDKLRLYHFLKHLKARGHTIDLFCLTRVKDDFKYSHDLRSLCRMIYLEHLTNRDLFFNFIGGALTGQSLNVAAYFSPKLRDALRSYWKSNQGQTVDAVLAHRLRMAPAAFESNPGKPVVLELTDCLSAYCGRLKAEKGARFSRRAAAWWDESLIAKEETEWGTKSARIVAVSNAEAESLTLEPSKLAVIPNGVAAATVKKTKPAIYPAKAPVVCFIASMAYPPNEAGALWFLDHVWPRVKERVPQAVFAAVGVGPRPLLKQRDNGRDIFVTGWVEEIEPYLTYATVSIAPLKVAAGMQNKVALSLALGVPVVSTSPAVGWLPSEGRSGVRTADTQEAFAQAVVDILSDPKKAKKEILRSQRFVKAHYRWADSGRNLEQILLAAVKNQKPLKV